MSVIAIRRPNEGSLLVGDRDPATQREIAAGRWSRSGDPTRDRCWSATPRFATATCSFRKRSGGRGGVRGVSGGL